MKVLKEMIADSQVAIDRMQAHQKVEAAILVVGSCEQSKP